MYDIEFAIKSLAGHLRYARRDDLRFPFGMQRQDFLAVIGRVDELGAKEAGEDLVNVIRKLNIMRIGPAIEAMAILLRNTVHNEGWDPPSPEIEEIAASVLKKLVQLGYSDRSDALADFEIVRRKIEERSKVVRGKMRSTPSVAWGHERIPGDPESYVGHNVSRAYHELDVEESHLREASNILESILSTKEDGTPSNS